MTTISFRHKGASVRLPRSLACVLALALASLAAWGLVSSRGAGGRAASDVPVAFWAWRSEAPADEQVARAVREARAAALFLRAGQIHHEQGRLVRVRAVNGRLPRAIALHLVYNATRGLLSEFERVDTGLLAETVAETFKADAERAARDGATLAGLQLDIDVPTRLLGRYAQVLRATRERLPPGVKLSVTGLPTWMGAAALGEVLDAVDFWVPQCYGAQIPERLEQALPISSPRAVGRAVERARSLGRPFYAGLAAYGYAVLYDARGSLVTLRGDLDPALVARDPQFELVERRAFDAAAASEWRYVYRARADTVVDGLVVRAGEWLMLDVPSAENLRACAGAARAEGGPLLLGVCVFRLPGGGDPSTLSLEEVAAALADAAPVAATQVSAARVGGAGGVRLTATNLGSVSALMGDDALVIEIGVPAGGARALRLEGFDAVEALCAGDGEAAPRPCGERRANVLRLTARAWPAGARARAVLDFNESPPPPSLSASIRLRTGDGRPWLGQQQITIGGGDER